MISSNPKLKFLNSCFEITVIEYVSNGETTQTGNIALGLGFLLMKKAKMKTPRIGP